MREILFRAKRIGNGEWVEGYFIKDDITGQTFIHAQGNSVNESQKIGEEGCLRFVAFEIDPETLCQYTGLTDKNGKRIWENDIVEHEISSVLGAVEWYAEDYVGWWVNDEYLGKQQFTDEMWDECVVIGNIFDNPELLGGAE